MGATIMDEYKVKAKEFGVDVIARIDSFLKQHPQQFGKCNIVMMMMMTRRMMMMMMMMMMMVMVMMDTHPQSSVHKHA